MAQLVGKAGYVNTGSVVAGIREWKLDKTYDMVDTTEMSDTAPAAKSFLPALYAWSGTFSGNHTDAVAQAVDGSSVTLKLYINNTEYYTGTAYVTGKHPSVTVDGEAAISYDFQGSGALDESNIT